MAYTRRQRVYRAFRTRRRTYKGVSFAASPTMIIGFAAGALAPAFDPRIEAAVDGVACMPVQGKFVLPIKMAAQGFRFGRIVRAFVPQIGGIVGGNSVSGASDSPWV